MVKLRGFIKMRDNQQARALPGVLTTIAAGFDLTARHLWLLLLPIALDVFYWIGPSLRFQGLIEKTVAALPQEALVVDLTRQLTELAPRTNLFSVLSVPFVGIPALMSNVSSTPPPFEFSGVEVDNWASWLVVFIALTVIGLAASAIYYSMIKIALKESSGDPSTVTIAEVLKGWLRLLGLALLFVTVMLTIFIPLVFMGALLFLVSNLLASIVMISGMVLISWLLFFLCLAPPGIILGQRPSIAAVVDSVRLTKTHLPATLFLVIAILVVTLLMDSLLLTLDRGTWITLVNIVGHAFVSTALVAALFIFYRDRYAATLQTPAL
jgi:hypothetical protein